MPEALNQRAAPVGLRHGRLWPSEHDRAPAVDDHAIVEMQ